MSSRQLSGVAVYSNASSVASSNSSKVKRPFLYIEIMSFTSSVAQRESLDIATSKALTKYVCSTGQGISDLPAN